MRSITTRFARIPKHIARIILVALVVLVTYGATNQYQSLAASVDSQPKDSRADAALYGQIIQRMQQGESYYKATGHSLRAAGYPTRPFLTWRLPTLATLLAFLPTPQVRQLLLGALALAVLAAWVVRLREVSRTLFWFVASIVWLGTALLICTAKDGVLFHELWSGLLIALSLAIRRPGRWLPSVLIGTLAMLFRETTLPYLGIMLVLAWREGLRREALGWLAGLAVGLVALAWHACIVTPLMDATGPTKGWLAFGGWPFVLATAQWNVLLILLPHWTVAVAIPLALLGLAGWKSEIGLRTTLIVSGFMASFMIVGQPFNTYWGLLYVPLLPLGWLFCPPALRDLWNAAWPRKKKIVSSGLGGL